ncbi:hypothetical protein [Variovorax sp. JS1663]|uniref:hypothetical protein n=1 Tax=Variovorax sp. JS1663 TaxID=1851577 RepID=UPI000B3422A5|nr:hypothetical protein [Variovorax sp. JS1663]OUL98368.1 hypothetical protein A8M77_32010 [Variovorax sp. JS1663]
MNEDRPRVGTLLFEGRDALETALSPDGEVRIEVHRTDDERAGTWITVQLIDAASGEVLVSEANHRSRTALRFPRAGIVAVTLTDRTGETREFEVEAATRRFRMYREEVFEPLALLPSRLGHVEPRPYVSPPAARSALAGVFDLVCALASLVFVIGGAWMMVAGETAKDRWTGLAGVVFFGLCFFSFLSDWRGRKS